MSETEEVAKLPNREDHEKLAWQILADAEEHAKELAKILNEWKARSLGVLPRDVNDVLHQENIGLPDGAYAAVRITEFGAKPGITYITLHDSRLWCYTGSKVSPVSQDRFGTGHIDVPIYSTWRRQLNAVMDNRLWTRLLEEADNQIELAILYLKPSLE